MVNRAAFNKKMSLRLNLIIVIVSILIIAGLVAGIVLLTGNSDDESNNTNTANNTVTNTNTNTNTNVNTNTNTNTVQPTPASTVSFLDYTLTVPNGFAAGEYSGNAYIQSNECLIMYMTYGMGYDTIIQNESVFLKSFKDNGLNITKSGSATFGSTKYYIIIGTLSGAEYGYMFSQMPNGKAFFATISSLNGGSIKDSYFQQAASFFATAR